MRINEVPEKKKYTKIDSTPKKRTATKTTSPEQNAKSQKKKKKQTTPKTVVGVAVRLFGLEKVQRLHPLDSPNVDRVLELWDPKA